MAPDLLSRQQETLEAPARQAPRAIRAWSSGRPPGDVAVARAATARGPMPMARAAPRSRRAGMVAATRCRRNPRRLTLCSMSPRRSTMPTVILT